MDGSAFGIRLEAERGPATIIVGALFTAASPPLMVAGAVRRRGVALHACRLGHGLKKLTAGTVLLRAGLVLAPLDYRAVPAAWLDGVVDAFQEDYCTSCTFSPASAIFGYSCSRPRIPSASRAAA